ncbi:hypothetical protein AVEN_212129-1 [Araneus ventricosus]|uniref:Uncharacterized protein n=2 Tax=Araneus ventricosus TaxID=182803 RepID=A0A4Y1ZRP1_ARAVE|nr:hypothetical protein AVEN_212129-1 [Araneus ventricosus]
MEQPVIIESKNRLKSGKTTRKLERSCQVGEKDSEVLRNGVLLCNNVLLYASRGYNLDTLWNCHMQRNVSSQCKVIYPPINYVQIREIVALELNDIF